MFHSLFDTTEELTLNKQQVIKDLRDRLQLHTHYFLTAHKSRKYNPLRMSLEDFVLDALLHVIQSMSLTSPTEMIPVFPMIMYTLTRALLIQICVSYLYEDHCIVFTFCFPPQKQKFIFMFIDKWTRNPNHFINKFQNATSIVSSR